jgi:predicted nucleic acid-binding protein
LFKLILKLKFDACSLIESQKLHLIPLINEIYGPIYVTGEVFNEAIEKGLEEHNPIAENLKNFVDQRSIIRINSHGILKSNVGTGEATTIAEVIHEANQKEETAFFSEDKKALNVAIRENLEVRNIELLLVEACILEKITFVEFEQKLLEFDSFHKLSLFRITELRQFVQLVKENARKGRT